MITVSATTFKAKCLALIEEMNRTRIPIAVTNRGKRVAEMYPAQAPAEAPKPFIGSMRGSVLSYEAPFEPASDIGEWDALR